MSGGNSKVVLTFSTMLSHGNIKVMWIASILILSFDFSFNFIQHVQVRSFIAVFSSISFIFLSATRVFCCSLCLWVGEAEKEKEKRAEEEEWSGIFNTSVRKLMMTWFFLAHSTQQLPLDKTTVYIIISWCPAVNELNLTYKTEEQKTRTKQG